MRTRTGGFPIGIRRGWSDWQEDLAGLIEWVRLEGFEVIDLGRDGDSSAGAVAGAGLRIGSADLAEWQGMISSAAGRREAAVARNADYIRACARHGVRNFFLVMLPEEPDRSRAENFSFMVEGFTALVPVLEEVNGRIVIEGHPGPGALCCTPEGYRAFFERCPSPAMGINYDPSHLIRMGIDPLRFLEEFVDRVYHVHGKDTELLPRGLYEYGSEQPPTFAERVAFGGMHWRYTIPGHGVARWTRIFEILATAGYDGCVAIELEDAYFNGTEAGEKLGFIQGGTFLSGC